MSLKKTLKPLPESAATGKSFGVSVGIVELPNLTDAISVLDAMLKSAGVEFVTWERKLGGRLVTLIVSGGAADVREAVEAARRAGVRIAAWVVIPNPHPETWRMINKSANHLTRGL